MTHPPRRRSRGPLLLTAVLVSVVTVPWVYSSILSQEIEPPGGRVRGEAHKSEVLDLEREPPAAGSGTLSGSLVDDKGARWEAPVVVTARREGVAGLRVTTYAFDGRFRLEELPAGNYEVLARSRGRQGRLGPVALGAQEMELTVPLDQDDAEPWPAAWYEAKVRFPSEDLQKDFGMQCGYCHQIGSPTTRRARTPGEWTTIIQRMSGMGALLRQDTKEALPAILAAHLDGTPAPGLPPPPEPETRLTGTRIREWAMGYPGGYIHDLSALPGGDIYGVDMNHDTLHHLDPAAGVVAQWRLPRRGHPRGGYLVSAMRPIGTILAHQAPHSIEHGHDGLLWTTNSLGNELMSFDPRSGATRHWSLPQGAYYPHTLKVTEDKVWFTVALSNHLGWVDLRTETLHLIRLPSSHWEQDVGQLFMTSAFALAARQPHADSHLSYSTSRMTGAGSRFLPLPYGVELHPDGTIWYTKLYDGRIGRYDPKTQQVREWVTPFVGPRRLGIGRDGMVWIPGFGSGVLARFEPATERFSVFPLPVPQGTTDRPYALNVAPDTGHVWITSTNQDVLYRFDPRDERFTVFPLPTRGAFAREIEFTAAGEVCTTYSNLPDAHLADPEPKVMCLRPPD
jgi:virginiamycin B lyase